MEKNKNIPASFGLFLTTFLIISTVIVFAVLLFLSYESAIDNAQSNAVLQTEKTCRDVVNDVISISGMSDEIIDNDETRNDLVEIYMKSELYKDNGSIYIIDSDANVLYTNLDNAPVSIKSPLVYALIDTYDENSENSASDLTSRVYTVLSIKKIGDSDTYCIVDYSISLDDVRDDFITVVVLPTIVSLLVSIALFVALTQLLIRPLKNFSQVLRRVGEGDYSVRVDKEFTNYDDQNIAITSDLQTMARTVNDMIERLENQEADRNVFISSVAHDIRTPLTSINGFITAMLDGTIPYEKQDRYLELIKQEVGRIRKLIVSMTEASSLSKMDPELMEEFNFKEMVLDIRDNLEPQLGEKSITLDYKFSEDTDHEVYGQSQELCRVVMNIITNAIKFTPVNGTIRLTTEADNKNRKLLIYVEDSGPGVEKEKRTRVFESFYKADSSRKQEGFGLGLYICKQILQGHGQTIYLDESKDLGGACFVFSFPYPPVKED